ncbi:hypothetical protein HAT2_00367 [Candidatus Similichlamydia laticola]|uniref:Uncharacterized protein n=1 Tax=Candidatus Similichlamydia laticola TaxID=2170265 RepID=A0A369KI75_9BACT|nr:hypothetical protein HAT2_00367 [Candidatus Similichlamydia laticola]
MSLLLGIAIRSFSASPFIHRLALPPPRVGSACNNPINQTVEQMRHFLNTATLLLLQFLENKVALIPL